MICQRRHWSKRFRDKPAVFFRNGWESPRQMHENCEAPIITLFLEWSCIFHRDNFSARRRIKITNAQSVLCQVVHRESKFPMGHGNAEKCSRSRAQQNVCIHCKPTKILSDMVLSCVPCLAFSVC